MTRWYPLHESDDEFLRAAPFRFAHTVTVPAPADSVWRVLTADDALTSWARGITGAQWTGARPFGVGTTRTVTIGHGLAALRERFYRWDETERMTFTAEAASRPGLRRFAEDISLEPWAGGTRVTWTFAVEAAPRLAPLLRAGRPMFRRTTAAWTAGIGRRVTRGAR